MSQTPELVTYRLEAADPDSGDGPLAAYLTLNDPERRNALSDALLDQLTAVLQRAASDTRVRVVVLTSSHPRVFSSGGNLDAFADDRATIAKYVGLSRFPAGCSGRCTGWASFVIPRSRVTILRIIEWSDRNGNTLKFGRSRVAPPRGTLLLERLDTFGQVLGREGQGELGLQVIQGRVQRQVTGCRQRPLTHSEQQR